jgi:hypothetical protein
MERRGDGKTTGLDCEVRDDTMPTLIEKLHPKRFPGMSVAAIVGYILGEDWSKPPTTATTTDTDPGINGEPNTIAF